MPWEVRADTACERSPSDAKVRARRAFTSTCCGSRREGGWLWRLEESVMNADHKESISPAKSALQRSVMRRDVLKSPVRSGPRRGGIRRHSLARAVRSVHAESVPVWWAQASVTAITSA